IYVEALIRGRNDSSIRHSHRTLHGSGEIGNRTGPLALAQHDFVRIVDEVLVWEHLEECNRLLFMGVYAVGGRLIRPAHDAIVRVIFPKCLQVLSVPRIVQLLHILEICCSIHNAPRLLLHLFHATSLSLFRYSAGTSSSGTSRVVTSET